MKKIVNNKFKQILSLASILLFLLTLNMAHAYDVEDKDRGAECRECHKINQKEASNLLKGFVNKVIEVKDGPIKGMWQADVEVDGRKFPVYIHYSKKYFFAGNIIDIKNRKVVGTPPGPAQKTKVDVSKIPLKDAIIIGDPFAKNMVIVFDDPDCPYCRKLQTEIKKIVSQRKDIAFYIKLFPLVRLHPDAYNKSKAIVCEKSLKLLDDALSGKKIPPPKCETMQIDENISLAASLGISSTPTIILKDGTVISGYLPADKLIALIDKAK